MFLCLHATHDFGDLQSNERRWKLEFRHPQLSTTGFCCCRSTDRCFVGFLFAADTRKAQYRARYATVHIDTKFTSNMTTVARITRGKGTIDRIRLSSYRKNDALRFMSRRRDRRFILFGNSMSWDMQSRQRRICFHSHERVLVFFEGGCML